MKRERERYLDVHRGEAMMSTEQRGFKEPT